MRRGGGSVGSVGWNVSSRESSSQGFLPLSSVVSTVRSRHHLASWNATEQGVEGLRGLLSSWGWGWVMAERWSINSSGTYH